jgi:RNA polymerase sigma-70 factor (ECF subfamily)
MRAAGAENSDVAAGLASAGPSAVSLSAEFQALYRAHITHVLHTLRRFGVRERDVEDVAHEVFLTVHRRFADFDRSRPVRPWLCGIMYRIALDHRRLARHRYEVAEPLPDVSDGARPADEALADAQMRRLLLEALEAIPLDRRAVLVMHDIDGVPMADVADALSVPVNTGYSRLRTARQELEAAVRRLQARGGAW